VYQFRPSISRKCSFSFTLLPKLILGPPALESHKEHRVELVEKTEVELKNGPELLGKDKQVTQDIIALFDPRNTT
jgi:hypothetical protein